MRRALGLTAVLALGCGPAHIAPYVEKHRDFETPKGAEAAAASSSGSLWRQGGATAMLFTDARALHESDLVVVKVEEVADAQRSADTQLGRDSSISAEAAAQINAYLAQLAKLKVTPAADLGLTTSLSSAFNSSGQTGRTERFTATVPATVKKVLPNGNLFIEGHRVILVNAEEHHFYISGVVRPIDIDQENSVKSSMIADAEIEFTGRGVLSDNQQRGWFSRYFGWIWPF
jgi:flagellar L-ring protein precursor FlgH